ncbi:MAG: hypothetical protein E7551_01620 [Ruminococcaceae bacterium]|nr:hypothetical protein [Oscillospiraceae bacterium]
MNNKGVLFLKIAVTALILVFIVYQTFSVVYKPITTATALYHSTYDGIEINGYFVREETIIDYHITGNERYVVEEGEKISKDGTIAEVYTSSEIAETYEQIKKLSDEVEILESINSVSDPSSVDLATLSNRIKRSYIEFLYFKDAGNFTGIDDYSTELLMQLNKKQILTGEVSGFDNLLNSLKNEIKSLKNGLPSPLSKVTAPVSGFFIHQSDGLEKVLTFDSLENIDETIFEKISTAKPTNAFGKIVSSQNFYIVSQMNDDDYLNFSVGDTISLRTPFVGSEKLKATVDSIKIAKDKNSAIVVLACQTMNSQFATVRSAPLTIVTEEYEGIKISNRAVHYSEGVAGVYVVSGSIVKFKPIEIVYRTETFTLCKKSEDGDNKSIVLYDEVIEKGKNLYDGKFIG